MTHTRSVSRQAGQGMTEYVIIVALIAIAAIAQELAGGSGATAQANAQTAATSAESDANTKRNLSNYTGNAAR